MVRIHTHRRLGPRMRVGLSLLVEGVSYREAARIAGLSSIGKLHARAETLGVRRVHRARRIERQRVRRGVYERLQVQRGIDAG